METIEQKAERWGMSVEDVLLHQKVRIAALQEAGIKAAPSKLLPGGVETPRGTPCELRRRSSELANRAIGREDLSLREWHEVNIEAAAAVGKAWTCTCGEMNR